MFKESLKPIFHNVINLDRGYLGVQAWAHLHLSPALLKSFVSLHNIHLSRVPWIWKLSLFSSLTLLKFFLLSSSHPYYFCILISCSFRILEFVPLSLLPSGIPVKLLFLRSPSPFSSSLFLLIGFLRPRWSPGLKHDYLARIPSHWITQLLCYSISPLGVASLWGLEALCLGHVHQLSPQSLVPYHRPSALILGCTLKSGELKK